MFNGGGGGHGGQSQQKAKNFLGACKRLISEIRGKLLVLLIISITFATAGSILSIKAPDLLSNLTDEITAGIRPNTEALQEISTLIAENYMSLDALAAGHKPDDIVYRGTTITLEDQQKFGELVKSIDANDKNDASAMLKKFDELPESIRSIVEPKMNLERINHFVILLAALYIISSLLTLIESLTMTEVTNKFAQQLRGQISEKINRLPLKYFDRNQTGDILSRITNDVDMVSSSLDSSLSTIIADLALLIGTVFMMFKTNTTLALIAIGSSLLGFVFMFAILAKSQKYFVMRQAELGKLNAHIEEVYSGLNVVKTYNGQKEVNHKFDQLNQKVYESNRKSHFLSGLMRPIMIFTGNFGYVAVCVVGAILASDKVITFGVIVAFMTYIRMFNNPLSEIAQAATNLQSAAAASERVFEFLDEPEMSDQKALSAKLDRNKVKGDIEFKNVKFGYDDDKLIIHNFSAKAKAGQKIAIVGPTGAGKTTMVNLLMKFYEINDGEILIDGVPTSTLTRENVHELFTMVLQDTWMFEGTLRENIIYNRKNVSDKQLYKICDEIGLTHFIKTLPNGFDTKISESDGISAGQKQLITIARGMVEDAPFLILDEATSNVDTRTEETVQDAMDKLMEGRTSFIIAHRLSTIKNADLILVMKEGNIIESGNHNQLMKQNGFYADLYNSQFAL